MDQKQIMILVALAICILCFSSSVGGGVGYYLYDKNKKQAPKPAANPGSTTTTTTPAPAPVTNTGTTSSPVNTSSSTTPVTNTGTPANVETTPVNTSSSAPVSDVTTPAPIVTPSPKSGMDGPDSIFLCSNGIINGTFKYGVWGRPGLPDKFDIYELSPGLKSITPPEGRFLDGIPGNSDNNAGVHKQYTITFSCSPILSLEPSTVIKSKLSSVAPSVVANTTSANPEEGDLIINRGSGKCLNVHYGVKANGTELNFFDCNANNRPDQSWVYANNRIRLRNSNYCVDVAAGDGSDGAKVQLWECIDGNNNQKFTNENASFRWWGADGKQTADRWLYNRDGKLVVTRWYPDTFTSLSPFQRFQT